jgi:hypothetical protein
VERCLVAVLDQREVNRWWRKVTRAGARLSPWVGGPPACRRHSAASPGSQRPEVSLAVRLSSRIASAERRVFQGSTPNVAKNVMAGACKAAEDRTLLPRHCKVFVRELIQILQSRFEEDEIRGQGCALWGEERGA